MTSSSRPSVAVVASLCLLLALLGGIGCSSTPKVDWNSRVGSYTYDQAVVELGPPTSWAKLTDGGTVAEWFLKSGSSFSFGFGMGSYGSSGGVSAGQSVTTTPKGKYLKLIFNPENKLQAWENVTH